MNTRKLQKDMEHSFPMITKGMNKGYEFTQQYNPELADLLRQIFRLLMKPIIALRAKLYRTILRPFRKLERNKFPFFRILIIFISFWLISSKNLSFSFSINNPFLNNSALEQTEEIDIQNFGSVTRPVGLAKPVNDYAPVDASYFKERTAEQYIQRYKNLAIAEMKKYGIPASITLAQALVESRAGNSKLARRNNNHFGVKCFSKKCGKGHCTNHLDDHHKDFFRKYNSVWESYRNHSQFLSRGRYAHLKKYGKDYKKWAVGLKKAGYATDKKYDKKLIGIVKRYKLYQYD